MKIKPRTACITIIYILLFLCAVVYMQFSYFHTRLLERIYGGIQLSIITCCVVYIILRFRKFVIQLLPLLLLSITTYELLLSYVKGLFITPIIFIDILPWPMVLYVFFDYAKDKEIPTSFRIIAALGLSIVCVFSLPNIIYRDFTDSGIFATYYCLAMLSLLYLTTKNSKTSLIFSAIVAILMLLTVKRAGIISAIVGIGVYYFLNAQLEEKNLNKGKKILLFTLGAVASFYVGLFLIDELNLNILNRLASISADGGSGRYRIWELVFDKFDSSTSVEKIFGHGFHAVYYFIQPFGIPRFAHNSYLEALYDYGIIGTLMIIFFTLIIMYKTWRMIREKDRLAPVMGYTVVIMLVLSLVSYFFEQSIIITPICAVWGICLGKDFNERRNRR